MHVSHADGLTYGVPVPTIIAALRGWLQCNNVRDTNLIISTRFTYITRVPDYGLTFAFLFLLLGKCFDTVHASETCIPPSTNT